MSGATVQPVDETPATPLTRIAPAVRRAPAYTPPPAAPGAVQAYVPPPQPGDNIFAPAQSPVLPYVGEGSYLPQVGQVAMTGDGLNPLLLLAVTGALGGGKKKKRKKKIVYVQVPANVDPGSTSAAVTDVKK